jgi:hypothetical protein
MLQCDVVLKSLFMRVGELSNDICNHLNTKFMMVAISNVPWCRDNTL